MNIYPHNKGLGGYVKNVVEWDRQEEELRKSGITPETMDWAPRIKHWLYAKGASLSDDGKLCFRSSRDQEVSQKIKDIQTQSSQGSFKPNRENDELTIALVTKEHPGHTRGIGLVSWRYGFPDHTDSYRKRGKAEQDELMTQMDACLNEALQQQEAQLKAKMEARLQVLWQQATTQTQGNQEIWTSPGGRRSSCASTGQPQEDPTHYLVDDITEPMPCRICVPMKNIMYEVGRGQVYPCSKGELLQNRPLLVGYTRVSVDKIKKGDHIGDIELDIHSQDGP